MAYKMIARKLDFLINQIEKTNDTSSKLHCRKYDDMYNQELWIKALYYRLISLAKNISMLINNDQNNSTIIILTRSCADCYIRIRNVLECYDLCLSDEKKISDKQKRGLTWTEEELNRLSQYDKIEILNYLEGLVKIDARLKDIDGKRFLESNRRYGIEVPEDIENFYSFLSGYVHSGHTSLMQEYVKNIADNTYCISKSKNVSKVIMLYVILFLVKILWHTTNLLYNNANQDAKKDLKIIERSTTDCLKNILIKIQKCKEEIIWHK